MTNIVRTNNQQLRLAQLSVGLLSTLRIALPMVPQSATNVEVIVTSGDTHNAYTATFDSTNHWWLCDIDASQFPTVGRQKYEVAYKISGDQFWDGQGWIEIVNATTSGITPAPLPDPYRYVVVTVNGYGATEADGAVRIPKLTIGTEDPSETTGYIEGDQYFNRTSGEQWVLCTVAGELTWVKCDSGVISVNGKVGAVSLDANDVGAYTKGETDAALAGKLDKTAVVAPFASATAGQAADAKAVYDAMNGKVDNVDGVIENQLNVGPDEDCTVIVGGKINHAYYDGIGVSLATIKLPLESGTFALTSDIDARLPYPLYAVPSTGLLKDRAINTTSLASVTVPDNFADLLIRASVASSLSVTMPGAIATKYGDAFPGEAGEYLITITKTGAAEAYVRTIKLEVANA